MLKKNKGFTLVELLIVIAIIGVLAAIAYPAYQNYILKTNRKGAMADMLSLQQNLARIYNINNGAYPKTQANTTGTCGGSASLPDNLKFPAASTSPSYIFTVDIQGGGATFGNAYEVTAIPCGNQEEDVCKQMRVNNFDEKTSNRNGTFAHEEDCF